MIWVSLFGEASLLSFFCKEFDQARERKKNTIKCIKVLPLVSAGFRSGAHTHTHHNTHHTRTQRRMNMFVHTLCPSPPPYHPKVRTYGGETGFNVHAVSIASISPDLSREEACPRGLLTFVRRRKLSMAKPVLIKQGITWQSKKRKESFGCWWIASFPIPTCRRSSSFSPAFPFVPNHPLPQRAHTAHTHTHTHTTLSLSPSSLLPPSLHLPPPLLLSDHC